MKTLWHGLDIRLQQPVDTSVAIVARRFAVRLLIVSIFAALPLPHSWGFLPMFVALTGFNAVACSFMALLLREKPNTHVLNHYDEALWMAMLFLVSRLFI